jgi:predicted transcriptional regulator
MHRRSWPEITTDILETTLTPSNKMRIMYRANLNFERFNKYFHNLLRKGFIEEKNGHNGRQVYQITETGKELLDILGQAQKLISDEEC